MRSTMIRASLAAAVVIGGSIGSAQAVTIGYSNCAAGDGSGLTSCVAGAAVTTFGGDPALLPFGDYAGNGAIVEDSSSGFYAQPGGTNPPNAQGDETPYLTVPESGGSGMVTLTLNSAYNYFGLYWGSMDNYNTLKFYNDSGELASVTGATVIEAMGLLGNQTDVGSNRYVDFNFGPDSFTRIEFISNGYAFESDNHAVANVPEPGALALLGLGLVGLGFARRRKAA